MKWLIPGIEAIQKEMIRLCRDVSLSAMNNAKSKERGM
jgi:hypothetical protein